MSTFNNEAQQQLHKDHNWLENLASAISEMRFYIKDLFFLQNGPLLKFVYGKDTFPCYPGQLNTNLNVK